MEKEQKSNIEKITLQPIGNPEDRKVFMFYGAECPYSQKMGKELQSKGAPDGSYFIPLEVWNSDNRENIKKRREYKDIIEQAAENAGHGKKYTVVPSFVDPERMEAKVNPSYEELEKWLKE